MIEGLV